MIQVPPAVTPAIFASLAAALVLVVPQSSGAGRVGGRGRNGSQIQSMRATHRKSARTEAEAFKSLEKTRAKHIRRNQQKTEKYLSRHPNLVVKKERKLLRQKSGSIAKRIGYTVHAFGHPRISRFVAKLSRVYALADRDLPEFRLITDRKDPTLASANVDSSKVNLSFRALHRIERGQLRELVHEMRHVGNLNPLYMTQFRVSPAHRYRFSQRHLDWKGSYDNFFSAEEFNNYWRWNAGDQRFAQILYLRFFGIHSEATRRLRLVDSVRETLGEPTQFFSEGELVLTTKRQHFVPNLWTHSPSYYGTKLSLPNFSLDTGVVTAAREAAMSWRGAVEGPSVSVQLFSARELPWNHFEHLEDSVELLGRLSAQTRKLARKRGPRTKP